MEFELHLKAKPVSHSKYAQFAQLEDYYKRVKRRNPLFSYDNIVVEHGNTATTTRNSDDFEQTNSKPLYWKVKLSEPILHYTGILCEHQR